MKYRGLQLDRFQEQAIGHLKEGHSVLVSAPTGTGKTIIADWIVDEALQAGQSVVYTAPIKALSNQKFRDYTRLHGDERVGLVTGDLVIRRDAPCRVMTTEILRNMLLGGEDLEHLKAVIIDEIHFLDDRERGTTWEEVLIYLPPHVQIVGLSATIANLHDFAAWLTFVRGHQVDVVLEETRAVPLDFFYASRETGLCTPPDYHQRWKRKRGMRGGWNEGRGKGRGKGRDRKRDKQRRGRPTRRTRDTDCFEMMADHGMLPYLYFVFSRRDTERYARTLASWLHTSLLTDEEQVRMDARLNQAAGELGPALDSDLRQIYSMGIAFHHAGLHVQLKSLVEELYEAKLLMVLYCTSTFALGINMPARSVCFDGLKKYDGTRVAPLPTRGFMQKAGRAGRRGMDDFGNVVIRLDLEEYEEYKPLLDRYMKGEVENVRSSFSLSWNSIVNLLKRHDEDHIRAIVDKSFLAWHLSKQVDRQIARAELLETEPGEHHRSKNKDLKEARRLRRRASNDEGRCWQEFQGKVGFLQNIGYLAEDNSFSAGAKVLQHLQISEMLTTEAVLAGVFEDIEPETLFGVLCGLVSDLPRKSERNFKLTREDRRLALQLTNLVRGDIVGTADEMSSYESSWCPDLIPIGRAWAKGDSLQAVLMMIITPTDISGDLVSCFRRAKDLAGQLRDVYSDMPDQVAMLRTLIKTVSRDEVEVVG